MAGGGQHLGTEDSLDYEKAMQSLEDREFDIAQQQSKITRKKIGALSVEVADLRLEVREVRDKLLGVVNDAKLSRDSSSLSTAVDINELRSELHNLKMAVTEICCFTLSSWPQCLPPPKAQHIQNGVAGTAHRLSHHAGEVDGHADALLDRGKLEELSDSDLTNILTQMRAQFDSVSKGTNGGAVLSTYNDTKRDRDDLLDMRERFEAQIANISAGIAGTEQKCLATTRASCHACKEELQTKICAVDEAWRAEICSLAAEVRHLAKLTSSLPQERILKDVSATTCEQSGVDPSALQRLDSHDQALASLEDRLRQVDTDLRTEVAGVTMDEKCLQQEVSNLKVLLLEEQDIHRSQMQQFEELLNHCRADVDKVLWIQDKSYQAAEAATKRSCEVPVQPRATGVAAPSNKAGSQTPAAPRKLSATLVPQQASSPAGQPPTQGAASPITAWPSLPKVPVLTAVRHPPSNRQPVRRQGSAPHSVWQSVSRNPSSNELSSQPVQLVTQALRQGHVRTGNMFDRTRDHSQSRSPPPREQRRHHSAEPLGSRLDSSPLPNPLRLHPPGETQAQRLTAPMRQQFPQVTQWLPQPSAAVTAAVGSAPPVAGAPCNRASASDLHSRMHQQQLATPRHHAAPASSCGGLASSTTSGFGSSTSGMASTATRLPAQFSETPLVVRHSQTSTNPSPVDSIGSRAGSASSKALIPASAASGGVPSLIGGEGTSHSDTCGPVIAPATASAALSMSVGQRSQPLVREANLLTAALEAGPTASCSSHAQAGRSDSTERGPPEAPQTLTIRPEQAAVLDQGGALASLTHEESVAGDVPSSPALSTPAHSAIKDLFDLPGSARSVSPRIMLSTGSAVTRHTLGEPHGSDIHSSRVAVSEELLKQMSHFLSPRETPRQVLAAHTAPAPAPEGPGVQGGR